MRRGDSRGLRDDFRRETDGQKEAGRINAEIEKCQDGCSGVGRPGNVHSEHLAAPYGSGECCQGEGRSLGAPGRSPRINYE